MKWVFKTITFIYMIDGIHSTPYSEYDDLNCHLKKISLKNKFRQQDIKFLFKLLHICINCPEHVERLIFKIIFSNSKNKPVLYL